MAASEETAVVRVQFNDEWIVRFHVSNLAVPVRLVGCFARFQASAAACKQLGARFNVVSVALRICPVALASCPGTYFLTWHHCS
eukprot:2169948-Rhodomonas_salina.1